MDGIQPSDWASFVSAGQDGEAYHETIAFNNNDCEVQIKSENCRYLDYDMLDFFCPPVMYWQQLFEFAYSDETGLPAKATLQDISAVVIKDVDTYLEDYQTTLMVKPTNSIIAFNIPPILRYPALRKKCAITHPYYERTIEEDNEHFGSWEFTDRAPSYFEMAALATLYASFGIVFCHGIKDYMACSPEFLPPEQAKKILRKRSAGAVHYKIRFSLMYDEQYTFDNGFIGKSFGAPIELFIEGTLIDKLRQITPKDTPIQQGSIGVVLSDLLQCYTPGPLQHEIDRTSPYVLMLLFLLFDDETTTALVSRLTLNNPIKSALKIFALNNNEDRFITFDKEKIPEPNRHALDDALKTFDINPKFSEAIRYDQTVRLSNILLKIKK